MLKKLTFAVTLVLGLLAGMGNASAQNVAWRGKIDDYYKYVGPDVDLQGGLGHHWDTADRSYTGVFGFGRLRAGILWVPKWPWALVAGATVETNSQPVSTWGGQVEALHLSSGLWFRMGGGLDTQVSPHVNAAVGWSLFGVEAQGYGSGRDGREAVAVLMTARVPVGYLFYVFSKR